MNRIKLLREEKNIYQKDLAQLLGVSVPTITYYENEKRSMDTKTASILADFFDVSIDYLLGKSDIRKIEKDNINENNINEIEVAVVSGIKKLNDENKQIAQKLIDGLLYQQKNEEKKSLEAKDAWE